MAMLHRYIRAEPHFPSSDSFFSDVGSWPCLSLQLSWPSAIHSSSLSLHSSPFDTFCPKFQIFFFFLHVRCVHCSSSVQTPRPLPSWCTHNTAGCSHSNTHNNGAEWQWFIVTLQSAVCLYVRAHTRARVFA